jgi:hypothetical protein
MTYRLIYHAPAGARNSLYLIIGGLHHRLISTIPPGLESTPSNPGHPRIELMGNIEIEGKAAKGRGERVGKGASFNGAEGSAT